MLNLEQAHSVLDQLPPIEQMVIRYRFGFSETTLHLDVDTIATKLGLSPAEVEAAEIRGMAQIVELTT